jgi:PAS domain-containing protein
MKKQTDNAVQDKIDLQTLKESEARVRSIVSCIPDAIIIIDAKG